MNVIHLARRFVTHSWGGTETFILEVSKCQLGAGHHARILCSSALGHSGRYVVEGVSVTRMPYIYPYWGLSSEARHRLDQKGGNLFSFQMLRHLQRVAPPDVIHLHTGKRLGGIARHVSRQRRIPYVISLHGGVCDVPAHEAQTWTEPTRGTLEWGKLLGWWVGSRRVLDDAAAIICVGQQEATQIRERFPGKRVVYLANGVDAQRFASGDGARFRRLHGISAASRVVLTTARIDGQKNQLAAVRALPRLLCRHPDIHLLFVGHVTSQSYYEKLLATIAELGLGGCVTVVPGVAAASRDLVDAYHAADLFLLPSTHEPFGIVILEAWAAGLPVVASRVGGIPSFVEQGRDGLLYEVDDTEGLIAQVSRVLGDESCGSRLGAAGRRKACHQFSWERLTARLTDLYEEVRDENSVRQ